MTRMVRDASPPPATRSILITSAPQSARIIEAAGTKVCSATSRTRTPSITSYMDCSSRSVVHGPAESRQILGPEHHPVAGRHIHQIEIHAGPGDLTGQVGEYSGAILDVDDHDFALAGDRQMRNRQGVLRSFGMWDQDVEFGPLAVSDAGR